MNQKRVDNIIKLCLAAAAWRDRGERELGPIHLLKYVYLADLLYSEKHNGETYTGTDWIFFNFGPWSPEVHERIKPAVQEIGATEIRRPSDYSENDWVRWHVDDEELLEKLQRDLPVELALILTNQVKKIGGDTYALLDLVYLTDPMLRAAPNEHLDFKPEEKEEAPATDREEQEPQPVKLSVKKRKDWVAKRDALRKRAKDRSLKINMLKEKEVQNPPIYDEVFWEGVQWLDSLAGEPIEKSQGRLIIDDSVWKSRARGERDVP